MESPEQTIRSSPSRVVSASASAKPDAEAVSETSSTHSGEQSDRRDVDILTQVLSTRSEEYRLLFRLPFDEVLVQDFNCALQENILLQGHMYLFIHHVCFYSNIFGFETKKTIPFHEITCVRKAKTAAIFPNAIEIFAGGKKLFFASFLSRDEAYRLIVDGWAQHSSDPNPILDRQESKSDPSSQDNGLMSERANECTQLTDDSLTSDRNKDGNISGDCKSLCNGQKNVKVSIKLLEVKENGEACSDHRSSGDLLTWQPEDVDAPEIPEYFTMVGEANFLVQVEEFFSLFISDHAAGFLEDFHTRCGDKDFRCTPWHRHEEFGHTRDISFFHPVKIPMGAKFGHCQAVQKLHIYRNSHLMIETSQQIGNIPFGDCFKVEGIWDVEQNANEESCCTLRVYSNVAFSKRTMFKGKIEQSTKDECREVYGLWINMAHDLLQQRNVENMEVSGSRNTESSPVGLGSSIKIEGPSQNFHTETCTMISPILSDNRNLISQKDSLVQEFIGLSTTMLSTFRYLGDTFCSYLKSQSHLLSILLVAFAATLFLMQIGIIILLMKGPKVHVVTQGNYVGTMGSYSVENVDWLEKHFNYLKEEMLLLETRMESMRHEYALLKVHLQSLGQLNSKS